MKIFLIRTLTGFAPAYSSDYENMRKLKLNEAVEAEIKRPRNIRFHKKFFALLNIGWENTPKIDMPFEVYRKWVTMRAGFVKIYHTPKGTLYEPESISFTSMNEDAFQDVYNRVLDVILKDTGAEKPQIEEMLITFF